MLARKGDIELGVISWRCARQAVIERHVNELRNGLAKAALKAGDHAPAIVLTNAKGETVDVRMLLKRGPVIVTFYRGGWCPYCNLELRAIAGA